MDENTPTEETTETVEVQESKVKSLAKKYWKPVAAGAAVTAAAAAAAYAVFRDDSDEDETCDMLELEDEVVADEEETPSEITAD